MTCGDAKRVSTARPCLVCGRSDWCLYFGPDDAPTAVICARIESAKPAGAAGWWHRLRDDDRRPARRMRRAVRMVEPQDAGAGDFGKLAADCCAAVRSDDPLLGAGGQCWLFRTGRSRTGERHRCHGDGNQQHPDQPDDGRT